jgi:Uma2 family endonuclease
VKEEEERFVSSTMESRKAMCTRPPIVTTAADHVAGPGQGNWTYEDYAAIPEDGKRYEVVDGVLFMTPAPDIAHQEIVGEIFAHLRNYVKLKGLGRVFVSPVDVRLDASTIVQPDVLVILNTHLERIAEKRILGAPDLVVEVASPATKEHDRHKKRTAYALAGVPEYWIVDPTERNVEVLILEAGTYYSSGIFQGQQCIPSKIATGLSVPFEQFFV